MSREKRRRTAHERSASAGIHDGEGRRSDRSSGSVGTLDRPPAPVRERPTPVAGAPGADDGSRHIAWRACFIGLAAGQLLLLLLTNGALDAANAAFGSSGDRIDGGIVGVSSFLAVIAGGFVAARLAGRFGLYQGTVVGIGFILVSIIYQFAVEVSLVHESLASGARSLVDLGPMRIDQVISGDLLALFGGSVGGLLARRR